MKVRSLLLLGMLLAGSPVICSTENIVGGIRFIQGKEWVRDVVSEWRKNVFSNVSNQERLNEEREYVKQLQKQALLIKNLIESGAVEVFGDGFNNRDFINHLNELVNFSIPGDFQNLAQDKNDSEEFEVPSSVKEFNDALAAVKASIANARLQGSGPAKYNVGALFGERIAALLIARPNSAGYVVLGGSLIAAYSVLKTSYNVLFGEVQDEEDDE